MKVRKCQVTEGCPGSRGENRDPDSVFPFNARGGGREGKSPHLSSSLGLGQKMIWTLKISPREVMLAFNPSRVRGKWRV